MTDRAIKILLALIAAGRWADAAVRITPAVAQDYISILQNIEHDLHNIYDGTCTNHKIC
jgi:hypothetical protein